MISSIVQRGLCKNLECGHLFKTEDCIGNCPVCNSNRLERIHVRITDLSDESLSVKLKFRFGSRPERIWVKGNPFGILLLLEQVSSEEVKKQKILEINSQSERRAIQIIDGVESVMVALSEVRCLAPEARSLAEELRKMLESRIDQVRQMYWKGREL